MSYIAFTLGHICLSLTDCRLCTFVMPLTPANACISHDTLPAIHPDHTSSCNTCQLSSTSSYELPATLMHSVQVNADRATALHVLSAPGALLVFCSLVENMPYVLAEAVVSHQCSASTRSKTIAFTLLAA